jgi:hypothetical protein
MKKLILSITIASSFILGSAFTPILLEKKIIMAKTVKAEICFKVKNDTGASITLHTGTGTKPMNNGTQSEFCLKEGTKLSIADKGKPGKTLLTVSDDISNKTFKLSELINNAN